MGSVGDSVIFLRHDCYSFIDYKKIRKMIKLKMFTGAEGRVPMFVSYVLFF